MVLRYLLSLIVALTIGISSTKAQSPNVTNSVPAEGFIGETYCFPATFSNAGPPGYNPYYRLVLPPGFVFSGASFFGSTASIINLGTVPAAPNNFVIDALTTASSTISPSAEDTIVAPEGSTVILIETPVGSLTDGGITLDMEICITVDPAAPIGIPVPVCVTGVYELGDAATGANGPIVGATNCQPITPILYRFTKTTNEIENPGPCHTYPYNLTVDIALAGTLSGPLTFLDTLPGTLQYAGGLILPGGCTAVQQPSLLTPGGVLEISCTGSYPGSTGATDMEVIYDAYIIDTLDETICDVDVIQNNASFGTVPGFSRDLASVQTQVEHVTLGHSASVNQVTIGATVTYTIGFDITQFTLGVTPAVLQFVVPDGMIYDPASLTFGGAPVAPANITIVPGPGTGSTVTVDIGNQAGAPFPPCSSPSLVYNARVNETYNSGAPVLSRDVLRHTSNLTYGLVEGASNCNTAAGVNINIIDISFNKTITNSPPTGPGRNGFWWPGDIVQYRLELQVPSRDLDDVVITDFFPLPIHNVLDLSNTFGTDVRFDPASAWTNPPIAYTRDPATNGLIMDFGDISDLSGGNSVNIILLIDIPITTIPFADRLFHSNFMQVNSDNSTADDITDAELTLIQVGAPTMTVTKGIASVDNGNATVTPIGTPVNGNATNVDANDNITYTVTVVNQGAAPAFDVVVNDNAPTGLINCALAATNPVVDQNGNPLLFSGGFTGNALTLTIDTLGPFVARPDTMAVITYVCQAAPNVPIGALLENTANLTWASTPGGGTFPVEDDDATARISDPSISKRVTDIFPGYAGTLNDAHIGEVISYEVQMIIPEGGMNNVTLDDVLDEGLAFVDVDTVFAATSGGGALTTSAVGGFNGVAAGATISNTGANPQQQDRRLDLNFANLSNTDNDNVNDTIVIRYSVIVINHPTNQNGDQLRNRANIRWDNPNDPGNRRNVQVRANAVGVIEPELNITKTFTGNQVLPGQNSFVTITVENLATSNAAAFDVQLTDLLPAGMTFISGFSNGGTASITSGPAIGGGTVTAHWDTINIGESYSITFEVQASSSINPCTTLVNCANLTWESIAEADEPNMPTAATSSLGIKRTGFPGAPGGAANTYADSSCANLDVIIDNTFDPFITGAGPQCQGSQLILTTRQYNGNIVRYNWTGPGVPANFNNNELIIDPLTPADTGTYFLFVELDGCITDTSNFFQVSLRPQPPVPNINPGDTAVCEGGTVVFSTDTVAANYTWSGPNGFTGNSASPGLISPVTLADAGIYQVFVTNVEGCSSAPAQMNLTVRPRPAQPSAINNSPICSGDNLSLSTNATASSYRWIAPNGSDTITPTGNLTVLPTSTLYQAGSWRLAITDGNGCESLLSLPSNVTIDARPAKPTVFNDSPICEGDPVQLSANTVNGGTYNWYDDPALTNLVATGQNPTINGLTAAGSPHTFYLQIDLNGCISDTTSTIVQVNAAPAALNPSYIPICSGDSLFLFANTMAASYNWTGPSGFVSNVADPIIANANASNAGSYSLSITDANGCTASGVVQVAIQELPNTPTLTGTTPVCEGDNITITSQNYTGNTISYSWSTPTGTIVTGVPTLTINNATAANNGAYGLVVTVDGCTSLPDSINIQVSPAPATPVVAPNQAVCEGASLVLSTPTLAANYNWTGPNGFSSTLQNPPAIDPVTAADAGNYTLVVSNASGCTSAPATTAVTVNPRPAAPAISNNSPICTGDTLVLSTTAMATSYVWVAPNGAQRTTATSTLQIPSNDALYLSGNWSLMIVDANGCMSEPSVASNVVINTAPANITASNNGPVCPGAMAQLFANTITGASYSWYTDPALSNLFSTLQNPMVNNLQSTATFYLVVSLNGCAAPADSTTITVRPAAVTPAVPADLAVCEGDALTLSTPTVAASYNWSGPNGFSSTAQNPPVISPVTTANAGVYTLSIVDANGCRSADTSLTVTVNGPPATPTIVSNSPLCFGDTLFLSSSTSCGQSQWIGPNGNSQSTLGTPGGNNVLWTLGSSTAIPANNANYLGGQWSMICIDTVTGCRSESAPIQVTINAVPARPSAFNNGPVCEGEAVTLSTTMVQGASYAWYADSNQTTLVATTATATINNITTDSSFYLVITVNGCASPMATTRVQVHPRPATPAVPADFSVCEGQRITLSTPTVAAGYNWTGPNGFSSTAQNPTAISNATTADAGTYTLNVLDANGCVSNDTSVVVTVDPSPVMPILSNNSAICAGDTLILSTTAVADSFYWIAPNGAITVTTNDTLIVTPATSNYQSGDWQLVVYSGACPSMPSTPSSVVINSSSTAPAAFNDGPVCIGGAVTLSTAAASGASYAWYSDSLLTNLIATSPTTTINNITTDSTFYLVVTVAGCTSPVGSTTVQIVTQPTAPAVPADFAVCEGDNITLSTTTTNVDTYAWTGPNGFSSTAQNPTVITNASSIHAGVYRLFVTYANGCVSRDTTVTVTVNPNPAIPTITSNSPICNGDTLFLSSSSNCGQSQWIGPNGNSSGTLGTPGGNNVLWTIGSNTAIPANNPNYLPGQWSMICIDTITGCRSESAAIQVDINAVPAQPVAFNNGPVCEGEAVTLSTAMVQGASYAWYADSNRTTLLATTAIATINNITTDSTFYLVISVNGCEAPMAMTQVQVHPRPATPAVPADFAVCEGDAITLSTPTSASAYNWTGPNGFSSTAQNPTVISNATTADAGTYTLSIIDANGCPSADTSVTVTVNPNPAIPTITSNSPICEGDTLFLSSSSACGQAQWIGPNGNSAGTLGTPGGNNVLWTIGTNTAIPVGNANYLGGQWSMICIDTVTGCRSESAPIQVEINPVPMVAAFNSGAICAGESVTLTASDIPSATYNWYSDSTLSTLIAATKTTTITQLDSTSTYYVVATLNGCASMPASTQVTVHPNPLTPAPSYNPLCGFDTLFLFANTTAASYYWTGPNTNNFTSIAQNPIIANTDQFDAGSYVLTVRDSFGCEATGTVQVAIYPKPATPTITNNSPVCEGENVTLMTQAYLGAQVAYIWTLPNGIQDTTNVPQLTLSSAQLSDTGTYTLEVWVDGCLSLPAISNVLIDTIPTTPAINANFSVCEGDNIALMTTTVAGYTYNWRGPNGFNSNLPNPTVVNASMVDSGTYFLNVTNAAGCTSLDTFVMVGINANPPQASIVSNSPICNGDTLMLSSSTNCGQSQWIGPNGNSAGTLGTPGGNNPLWTIGASTMIPPTDPNYLSGTWYMVCIDTLTGCSTNSDTITVEITPIPATPVVFNNGPICSGDAVDLSTANITGASYTWYADSNLTTIVATSQQATIPNITTDSTFYLVVTVNGCSSLPGSTTVTVRPAPATPAIPANFAVCEGDNIQLFTTTAAAQYNWTGPNGFSSNQQQPAVVVATLADSGTYTLFIVDANGCRSADTTVQVTIHENPAQPVLSSNSAICDGDSLIMSTTAIATSYLWMAPNGDTISTTTNQLMVAAASPFYQAGNWTVMVQNGNGCMSVASAPEQVVIHSIPAAQAVFNNGPICSGASVNLSTSFLAGAVYEWYADSTQTTLVAVGQNPTINNLTTDSTFYLVITQNGCTDLVGSTTVVVYPIPAAPDVPADFTVCEGDDILLSTSTNASAYVWSGPNGFSSTNQNPSVVTATLADSGQYTLFVIDANGCRSADTAVVVNVDALPDVPAVTNDGPACEGDNVTLSASTIAGATYEWFKMPLGTSVGTGQNLVLNNVTVADSGRYYVVATINNCATQSTDVTTVVVNEVPTAIAFAGMDQALCAATSTTLNATPTTGSITGTWTTNSTATISNPTAANATVYNLPVGTSTFFWTLSNGACQDFSIDSMQVTVTPLSTEVANAGLDQNLCGATTATLGATAPVTSTGRWEQSASQAGSGVVITTPTDPASAVTGLMQGNTYAFVWVLTNGACGDYSTDTVFIQVDVAPIDNAYAGTDILICNQNTVTLGAQNSQFGTGLWTSTSTATIIDPTDHNTIVINLPQDTSVFVWTLSNGTCANYSTDSMIVVVSNTTDTADAGLNQVICVNNATLAAVPPSTGTGQWSQTAAQAAQGVVIVDPNDPNSAVVGMAGGTTYAFTWTLSNNTCVDYSSDITTITVNATPPDNAFAGNDINLCGNNTTTTLGASTPTTATGFWTTTSGATISNPTQPNSTVSGLGAGVNVFVWTLSSGSCIDYDSDTVLVTVTAPSSDVADAGLDSAYCNQSTVTLNAAAPSVGGGYWSQTPSQASLGAVINNSTSPNTTVSGLTAGVTYTFTWTLTNGGCVDYSSDDVLITIDVLPTNVAFAGMDTVLCGGNSVELNASTPPIGTGFWTTNDTATIVTPSMSNSLVVNIQEDTTRYYWTLSNGACVDYSVDSVDVIISPTSTDLAFAGFDAVLCGVDSIILSANVPTTSVGVWTQSAGQLSQGVTISNPNDPNAVVQGIQAGQVYTFVWTLSTTGCTNFSSDDVEYTINALPPEVAYAGTDIIVCDGNTTILDANTPVFSSGVWSTNSSAVLINPTLPNSNVVNMPNDTIEFYWSLSNGSCTDYSIDTVLVIVTETFSLDTANAGLDINICNDSVAQLAAVPPTTVTGRWTQPQSQASDGVVIVDPTDPNTFIQGLQLDSTYTFTWSVSNGPCEDYDSDAVEVRVSTLPPDAAYAGLDVVICGLNQAIVTATAPSVGTGIWTTPTSATIVTPTNRQTELLNLGSGTNMFIWTLSNGACIDYSSDTMLITVDDAPIANADSFVVIYNNTGNTIDVLPNDQLNSNWVISITQPMASGTITNLGNGQFDLLLQDVLVDQQFIYQLCNPNCPAVFCDTALVIVDVQGGTVCNIPNLFTPNGDDANDNFVVPCLDGLTDTKLLVFNRWGDQIYQDDNYQNNWGGTHNGVPVPDATYFYIMELADGRRFQGFVEVRR